MVVRRWCRILFTRVLVGELNKAALFDESLSVLRRGAAANDAWSQRELCGRLWELSRWDELAAAVEQVKPSDGKLGPEVLALGAIASLKRGDIEKAKQSQQNLALRPDDPEAQAWAAVLQQFIDPAAHDAKQAIDSCARAGVQRSGDVSVAVTLASAWAAEIDAGYGSNGPELNRLADAIQAVAPGEEKTLCIKAGLLARSGNIAAAKAMLLASLHAATAPSEQTLLHYAGVSQALGLAIEQECFDRSEKEHGITPALAYAAHDVYEARIVELARLVIGLGLTLIGTAAAYNAAFVRLWVGPAQYGGDLLSAATAAALVVSGFQLLFAWALDIQGDARRRTKISITGAVLNLVLSVSLAYTRLGVAGVAIGTLAAYLLTEAWFGPYLVCTLYGVRARRLLAGCGKGLALGLPWAVAVWIFARWHAPLVSQRSSSAAAWARLLLECASAGALSVGYCWIVILTREERSDWSKRLRRIIR